MSACDALVARASEGVAPSLRAVDCLSSEMAASAFGRLFGSNGSLAPVLTAVLTIYVAFFAISLLTGRSRISVSALTPRMLTLGMVLTFSTSWIAYQGVVWNLAVGGPDQVAGILTGSQGSATQIFADKLDIVFTAIAEAGGAAGADPSALVEGAAAQTPPKPDQFTPADLMQISALVLLLGTVGVLLTARIALAVLLALGPVFVVLALFPGTRGLTAGWLRGVVLTAVTPLFVVLGGSLMLELLVPVLAAIRNGEEITGRGAMALFTIASVHAALMAMSLRVGGTIVSGWRVFGLDSDKERESGNPASLAPASAHPAPAQAVPASVAASSVAASTMAHAYLDAGTAPASSEQTLVTRRTLTTQVGTSPTGLPPLPARRASGIGSRFRAPRQQAREMIR